MNDKFNYYFSRYIDNNLTFKQLVKKIIELMDEGKDFDVEIEVIEEKKEDCYLQTR